MKDLEVPWKEYSKTLPTATKIYEALFKEPESHEEWANKINKVGDINKVLISKEYEQRS
jgi:hypothetical protein